MLETCRGLKKLSIKFSASSWLILRKEYRNVTAVKDIFYDHSEKQTNINTLRVCKIHSDLLSN